MSPSDPRVKGTWQETVAISPHLEDPVPILVARDIPYVQHPNRLQNLSLYLPRTAQTSLLVGTAAYTLPGRDTASELPRSYVHIHGGAWRDPHLTSASIEATVAHAFSGVESGAIVRAIASIDYTVTKFPSHPLRPYDPIRDNHTDPAREAVHPQHVSDVLHGLALLRSFGLTDGSYILSGHSCGACLAFQSLLQPPRHYGLCHLPEAPCPAGIMGLNGLYDLLALVHGLGPSHEHLSSDYETLLSNAFGADQSQWAQASPARFDPATINTRMHAGRTPRFVLLDQSTEDQLVPINQRERFEQTLAQVDGLHLVRGHRCTGEHAAPWEHGHMMWQSVQDALDLLKQ